MPKADEWIDILQNDDKALFKNVTGHEAQHAVSSSVGRILIRPSGTDDSSITATYQTKEGSFNTRFSYRNGEFYMEGKNSPSKSIYGEVKNILLTNLSSESKEKYEKQIEAEKAKVIEMTSEQIKTSYASVVQSSAPPIPPPPPPPLESVIPHSKPQRVKGAKPNIPKPNDDALVELTAKKLNSMRQYIDDEVNEEKEEKEEKMGFGEENEQIIAEEKKETPRHESIGPVNTSAESLKDIFNRKIDALGSQDIGEELVFDEAAFNLEFNEKLEWGDAKESDRQIEKEKRIQEINESNRIREEKIKAKLSPEEMQAKKAAEVEAEKKLREENIKKENEQYKERGDKQKEALKDSPFMQMMQRRAQELNDAKKNKGKPTVYAKPVASTVEPEANKVELETNPFDPNQIPPPPPPPPSNLQAKTPTPAEEIKTDIPTPPPIDLQQDQIRSQDFASSQMNQDIPPAPPPPDMQNMAPPPPPPPPPPNVNPKAQEQGSAEVKKGNIIPPGVDGPQMMPEKNTTPLTAEPKRAEPSPQPIETAKKEMPQVKIPEAPKQAETKNAMKDKFSKWKTSAKQKLSSFKMHHFFNSSDKKEKKPGLKERITNFVKTRRMGGT